MRALIFCLCFGLAGCASVSNNQIAAMGTDQLCQAYAVFNQPASRDSGERVRNELMHRGLISSADWQLVDQGRIGRGMGKCAAFALLGPPSMVNEAAPGIEGFAFPGSRFVTFSDGLVANYIMPN